MNPPPATLLPDIPFVNEIRLNARLWVAAIAAILISLLAIPRIWKHAERFETGVDYRIPYSLSRDYWLYERRLERLNDPRQVLLLGDSVVWGEYVLPDGTLSHFLNQQTGGGETFINAGVNGLFPLALEGLVNNYAESIQHRKVILHLNFLWMSSPKADLQVQKEERFNHSRLVPQFRPWIPCYKANANERLSVLIERNVQFMSWVTHLQSAYYNDRSVPAWTLEEDSSTDPPTYPNSYKNPFKQITMVVPSAPNDDPLRGPASSRHQAWTHNSARPTHFDWVTLESSLQWAAFKRTVQTLRDRRNDVLVLIGPFNEHMVAPDNLDAFRALREGAVRWLTERKIAHIVPDPLPSELYADASHPLTSGYEMLATALLKSPVLQQFTPDK